MKKFEYSVVSIKHEEFGETFLNKKGQEGWELIQYDYVVSENEFIVTFKREIDNEVFNEID